MAGIQLFLTPSRGAWRGVLEGDAVQRSDGTLGEGYIDGTPLSLLDCDGIINLERIWAGQVLPMYAVVWC